MIANSHLVNQTTAGRINVEAHVDELSLDGYCFGHFDVFDAFANCENEGKRVKHVHRLFQQEL